jgi:hypothetical protein
MVSRPFAVWVKNELSCSKIATAHDDYWVLCKNTTRLVPQSKAEAAPPHLCGFLLVARLLIGDDNQAYAVSRRLL